MDKIFRAFKTHQEADRASQEDDAQLSTSQRLANFLEMMAPIYGSSQRIQIVYRTRDLNDPEVHDHWRIDL